MRLVRAVVDERKKEKRLQILGTLAWGSFLDSYMKKAKPRPKSFFQAADQRWTLKGVFRFSPFSSRQLVAVLAALFGGRQNKKALTRDFRARASKYISTFYTTS
ncbi:hypothetical protein [uncultured Brevibacillus sp.]|uniref:hypothetical protein n=1 Tax=uncultured Brevibacillus sp. TaxID=169970 RepID=UPI002598D646|nr:hypothetical protein [uncultured Brevibacillus sp.]